MVRVLIVTPSYLNTQYQLGSTHKDGKAWHSFFVSKGILPENITWLSEENDPYVSNIPTYDNIIREIVNLTSYQDSDSTNSVSKLVFVYAGHGIQNPSISTQEVDGRDECILSTDGIAIVDDSLKLLLVDQLARNQQLFSFFDCCHSKTMLDIDTIVMFDPIKNDLFFFNQSTQTTAANPTAQTQLSTPSKENNLFTIATIGAASLMLTSNKSDNKQSLVMMVLLMVVIIALTRSGKASTRAQNSQASIISSSGSRSRNTPTNAHKAVCLSACRDSQFAYENVNNGYFTQFTLQCLQSNPDATIRDVLLFTGTRLVDKQFNQHPACSFNYFQYSSINDLTSIKINSFFQ